MVGFGETPQLCSRCCRWTNLPSCPAAARAPGTDFGPAFAFLRDTIDRDVDRLERHRLRVHRPLVFFLSDGQPTDPVTWPAAFAALTDPTWARRPDVIAFGVGDADADALGRIGTFRMYLGRDGIRVGTALIASVMHVLSTSRPPADRTLFGKETSWKRTEGDRP